MAMKPNKKAADAAHDEINVVNVKRGRTTFCVLGTEPFFCHSLSAKVQRELLMPSGKKTAADKATTLKHDPYDEFRTSPNIIDDEKAPTLIGIPSVAFKCAMRNAAIDLPGSATKAAIGRLAYVEGDLIPVFGVPKIDLRPVRMSDVARTPDVRSRAIIPAWACYVTVSWVSPILKEIAVMNLLAGAGLMQGVGDFRTEKGKGNFGSFELVEKDDPRFLAIIKDGGREAQRIAMNDPVPYNAETSELLTWFTGEVKRRDFKLTKESA